MPTLIKQRTAQLETHSVAEQESIPSPLLRLWLILWTLTAAPFLAGEGFRIWHDKSSSKLIFVVTLVALAIGAMRLFKTAPPFKAQLRWSGLVLVIAAVSVNACASFLHLDKLQLFSLIATSAGMVWALYGPEQVKHWAPLAVLAPFLSAACSELTLTVVSVPLQRISSDGMVWLAHFLIPIHSSSQYFVVNGNNFAIATGCSGLTMWMSLLFAFALWQVFMRFKIAAYVTVFIAVLPITLGLNVLRLLTTALLAYYANKDLALACHSSLEAFLLPIGMAALWYLGKRYRVETA
ncbi:MAG TPA: archaeosortase/exosortase family protein [Planktothrix sp.]